MLCKSSVRCVQWAHWRALQALRTAHVR